MIKKRLQWFNGIPRPLVMLAIVACLLLVPVHAIYESQAGVFDWHHTWVGKPRWSSLLEPNRLAVATERNVLASIDSDTGALVWRQILDGEIHDFKVTPTGVLTVSQEPGVVQLWEPSSGRLLCEYAMQNGDKPMAITTSWGTGNFAVADSTKVVLFTGCQPSWIWNKRDSAYTVAMTVQENLLFVVDQSVDRKSFTVTVLDAESGKEIKTTKLPTDNTVDNIVLMGKHLMWTEKDKIKWNELGAKQIAETSVLSIIKAFKSSKNGEFETVKLMRAADASDLVFLSSVFKLDEENMSTTSVILQLREGKDLVVLRELGVQERLGAVSSTEHGIARMSRGPEDNLVLEIYSRETGNVIRELRIEHDFLSSGDVVLGDVISIEPLRVFVTTESGSVFAYEKTRALWSREEAMAHATAAEFLELPEKQLWTQMADELSESTDDHTPSPFVRYFRRLEVHATELRQLPDWIVSRILGAVTSSSSVEKRHRSASKLLEAQSCNKKLTTDIIYRDNFGLRKLLISVTATGKVIAQDAANSGSIVWSRYFPGVEFEHVLVVRAVSVKLPPIVVVVGRTGGGYEETHFYRLDGLTGQDYISSIPEAQEHFEPQLITATKLAKVMRLPIEDPEERTHILALFEAGSGRVYIYPDTHGARDAFKNFMDHFYFIHQTKSGLFKGYKVAEGYRGSLYAVPVWTLDIPADEKVVAVGERQPYEKVALMGRVLGNRNVLYKYLNPHMFAVLSTNPELQTLKVRIVDGVKGTVLYEALHRNVDAVHNPVHVVQAEHWVVYHFWSNGPHDKGYQTAVLELYEGELENERIPSANFSSFDNIQPHVRSASFMFPYPVTAMGVTTTRNGISTREILFGLPSHQIFGVNKRLLDPRRPKDKPTKQDQEEGLIPYSPIPDERQMFLTYNLEVAGIKRIITSPALLESTSLVFAFGLDTFFTRSSPSRQFDVLSEDFSKSQLILTIVALGTAILIAGPIVRRKRVNALWK